MRAGRYRALNTLLFIGATILVVTSAVLKPDPSGIGTHAQLGLGPCVFLEFSGLPCPACGWTTSFAHVIRGEVIVAWWTQPFGTILAVSTGLVLIVSGAEALSPRDRWTLFRGCFKGREVQFVSLLFGAMFAAWAFKITQKVIFLSSAA